MCNYGFIITPMNLNAQVDIGRYIYELQCHNVVGLCPRLASLVRLGSETLINSSEHGFGASVKSLTTFPGSSEISTSGSGRI
jgi:hypothetical protein